MAKRKKYDKVDYVFVSAKKDPEPKSKRIVTKSFMNGSTLVQHITDKDMPRLVIGGRYNVGFD